MGKKFLSCSKFFIVPAMQHGCRAKPLYSVLMSLHFNLGLNLTEKLNCFLNKTKLKRKKEDWFGAGQVS